MSLAELRTVLDWAADEGWNPGLDDANAFHAADPDGFVVAQDGHAPVAAISVVNHSQRFAFLGLYICRPSYRGRGIGPGLWRAAIARAGSRTIGLDGVRDQQENYARSGFERAGTTTRYSGHLPGELDPEIRRANETDMQALVALETKASGWSKPAYMRSWFSQTVNRVTYVLGKNGNIDGCATVRRCRTGAKIGPLVADGMETAKRLIAHAAADFCTDLTIDVPSSSTQLDALCRRLGFMAGFRTARMYRGNACRLGSTLYAVASLELG